MIIQCPACATNFFLDERKFNGSAKKLKCSRCSIVWTSGTDGKPIDIPKLYEPASSQGIKTKKERINHSYCRYYDQCKKDYNRSHSNPPCRYSLWNN